MSLVKQFMHDVVNPIGLIIFIVLILGIVDAMGETTTNTVDITIYPQTK